MSNRNTTEKELSVLSNTKEFKNYKELCVALDWKISTGGVKIRQMSRLGELCRYTKNGNKYIIDLVKDNVCISKKYKKSKVDMDKFKVDREDYKKAGIYRIYCNDGRVYIGSTVCLMDRFQAHLRGGGTHDKTKSILDSGGVFEVLLYINLNDTTVEEMRAMENDFIKEYRSYANVNCINGKLVYKDKELKANQEETIEVLKAFLLQVEEGRQITKKELVVLNSMVNKENR